MDKVDRLGWTAGIAFTSYGVRVGVRANQPEAIELLKPHFPPVWKLSTELKVERLYSLIAGGRGSRSGVKRFNLLYSDAARISRSAALEDVVDVFESDLHLFVSEMARRRVFVHAGVVAWRGNAIMIPGRSFSGKSTLVAELVKAGATYYSDEYAVLDPTGRVHPFARPLAMRVPGSAKQTRCDVEQFGGRKGAKPLPVKLVLLSHYKPGARWRPRTLSAGQGALELLNNTTSIRRQPAFALDAIERVVSSAVVLKGSRGEARELAARVLATFRD